MFFQTGHRARPSHGYILLPALMLSIILALIAFHVLQMSLLARESLNQTQFYLEIQALLDKRMDEAVAVLRLEEGLYDEKDNTTLTFIRLAEREDGSFWKVRVVYQPMPQYFLEKVEWVPR